jgi:glycosyltransferase involved in cell wall biosynthesis
MGSRQRLLIVSFSYPRPVKREKLDYLTREYDLLLIHTRNFLQPYVNAFNDPVKVITVGHSFFPFSLRPNTSRILMHLPVRQIRRFNPHFVYIDSELWCPTLWFIFMLKMTGLIQARILVHSLTNQIIGGWRGWLRRIVYRHAASHLTLLIGSSTQITQVNQQLCAKKSLHYAILPHIGPSAKMFYPRTRPNGNRFTFGYLGRLVEEKGLRYLIAAFEALPEIIRTSAELHIYGDGPQRADLEKLASRSNNIVLGSYVDPDHVAEVMRSMDVFVLPSVRTHKDLDQWPISLVEAMLTGLPIIATSVGGIPELLHGHGTLVPEKDPAALAGAMERVYREYTDRVTDQALGSREYAIRHYSGEALAERLGNLLQSVIRTERTSDGSAPRQD